MADIKTGVELELWVVDRTGQLCDGRPITETHDRITPEFIGARSWIYKQNRKNANPR